MHCSSNAICYTPPPLTPMNTLQLPVMRPRSDCICSCHYVFKVRHVCVHPLEPTFSFQAIVLQLTPLSPPLDKAGIWCYKHWFIPPPHWLEVDAVFTLATYFFPSLDWQPHLTARIDVWSVPCTSAPCCYQPFHGFDHLGQLFIKTNKSLRLAIAKVKVTHSTELRD